MLTHALRSIKAGWTFQLNTDVTRKLCRKSVDLLAFSVTSLPRRNKTMCLCIIPSTTESAQALNVVYNELRKAGCLVPSIKHCNNEDCVSCNIVASLLADAEVGAYVKSKKCAYCILPVETAMCDNFKGLGNFMENVITSNVCLPHATGNVQVFCALCIALIPCVSGIAVAKRSHIKQFPIDAAYNYYYDILVDTGEISVEQFATLVQLFLVQYLRARYGADTANWYETYWLGDCGRYCLVHSQYGGYSNKMGVEVTWQDIKQSCDPLGRLGSYIAKMCGFIATALGEENMKHLKDDSGVQDTFI
jgi:hypothetical protein